MRGRPPATAIGSCGSVPTHNRRTHPYLGAYLCYAYAALEAATVVQRVTYALRYLEASSVKRA